MNTTKLLADADGFNSSLGRARTISTKLLADADGFNSSLGRARTILSGCTFRYGRVQQGGYKPTERAATYYADADCPDEIHVSSHTSTVALTDSLRHQKSQRGPAHHRSDDNAKGNPLALWAPRRCVREAWIFGGDGFRGTALAAECRRH
jgi:hypothetical protein